jgi:superfamily II DNA or RNA helicase
MTVASQLGFFDKPVRAGAFMPRSYQVEADAAIDRELAAHRSTLVVQATGLGKTVLFCMQAKKRGNGLVLVHRDTLARQACEKLSLATGMSVAIEKAERTAFGSPYVVGSVQTLKGERLKKFADRFRDVINFIITDEAHRSPAASYRKIYEAFPHAKLLGVTATPDRSDEVAMGSVYDSVAHRYELIPATQDAWLTPVEYIPLESEVNLDSIDKRGGDLDPSQLDDAVATEAGRLARAIIDHARDKRLIVFTPGVKTAHALSAAMNDLVPGHAASVDGTMDDEYKRRVEQQHRAGEISKLVNCNIYTEGHDDPTLDGIVDTAPSCSRLRVMQRLGRATRLWPEGIDTLETVEARVAAIAASPKPKALWYDLVCNGERHSVIGPLDVLAGKLPDEVRKAAKKILEEEGGGVDAAISKAQAQLEERERAMRAGFVARRAKSRKGRVRSIFELAGVAHMNGPYKMVRPEDMATPKQIGLLKKLGIPIPQNCTGAQFKRLLGKNRDRERRGLCQLGGVHWLQWFGVDAWNMSGEIAKRIQREIILNGRKPLPPERIAELSRREPGDEIGIY